MRVRGVTQLDNIVYVVHARSATIKLYHAVQLNRLTDIHIDGMKHANDIVLCRDDRHLYVADWDRCIWRVSADDHSYVKWLPNESTPDTFRVHTLSLTSRRLLVTSRRPRSLRQYCTTDRELLRVVQLPGYVKVMTHSVQTSRGTFVIGHLGTSQEERHCAVSDPF